MGNKYICNSGNAEMFGTERNGYSKERVDNYVSQLESNYCKVTDSLAELKELNLENKNRIDELTKSQPAFDEYAEDKALLNSRIAELETENRRLLEQQDKLREEAAKAREEARDAQDDLYDLKESKSQTVNKVSFEPNDYESQKMLLANVLIDAKQTAEAIILDAKAKAVETETISRAQVKRIESEKTELQEDIISVFNKFKEFVSVFSDLTDDEVDISE